MVPVRVSPRVGSMQTTLKNTCPKLTLIKMLAEHRTGSLMFTDQQDPMVVWRVHLDQGKIVFADSFHGHEERLNYFLKMSLPNVAITYPSQSGGSIYSDLCEIWAINDFLPAKLQHLLAYSTQEVLIQIFAMRKCDIVYDPNTYFPPIIKSSSFSALIDPVEPWISQWRGIRNEVNSPFQRLFIQDWDLFFSLINYTRSRNQQLHPLDLGLGKNYTLYELATHLRMTVRELAVMLHPMIRAGAIGVRVYQEEKSSTKPLVASLNQKRFDRQLTRRSLERSGFDVLMLQNPLHCVQQLAESKPAVALLDSNLNHANVFDMCRQIRKVESLKSLPIILLMREEHLWGETRGKWAGANDCLSNPIRPQELIRCVKHWQLEIA